MTNVVAMKPKSLTVHRGRVSASIVFLPVTREWQWKVAIKMDPQVFTGVCATMREAQQAVDEFLRTHN